MKAWKKMTDGGGWEKMNEMERMLSQYQEKLDNVTSSYEEKVNILENRLVDREMEQQPQPPDGQGGETFIRYSIN